MPRARRVLFVFAAFVSTSAAARNELGFADFVAARYPDSVDMSAYAADTVAQPPANRFEGRLILSGQPRVRMLVADAEFVSRRDAELAGTFPADFDFEFVQDGDTLIPLRRGPIAGRHGWWEFALEPGRVWNEADDQGYTRAAIPFALVQKNANCTHNGVLMLLFKADGAVAHAAMQISSETCKYLQLDMWGMLKARYVPEPVARRAEAIAAWRKESAARLPVRTMEQLGIDHPDIDIENFFIGDAAGRTLTGLVVDGIHYRSGCATRHGDFPYCDSLDLPSFSLAKTVVAGLALMRLQRLYPGASDLDVSRYAGAPCRAPSWQGARAIDLLDMASGHYDSPAYMADEDAAKVARFFDATGYADKLAFACTAYPRKETPHGRWVYRTSDTFLLGATLTNWFRSLPGHEHGDVFDDVVVRDLYAPLDLSPTARVSRRTYDARAQPFFGWGLTLLGDDVAKLARFLGPQRGMIGETSPLDRTLLDQAMQRDEGHRGLVAAHLTQFRYQHGLWARNVQKEIGCAAPAWVPFMAGFGGITVAMFPNGVVWYNFADDGQLKSIDFARPAIEANKLSGFCPIRSTK
ncbi:MAG: hypothetical protein JSS59_12675 [Proteobacteria bacterium]|uniref:hypothetical protein n=1 Tax=Rudaea sp. TaxID=2136325 RepID=UPI00378438BD|nr:hypothetical protein [Pseudomonadota bacterium]